MSVAELAKQRREDFTAYAEKVAKIIEDRFNALKELTPHKDFEFKAKVQIEQLIPQENISIYMGELNGNTAESYRDFRLGVIGFENLSNLNHYSEGDSNVERWNSSREKIAGSGIVFVLLGKIDFIVECVNSKIAGIGDGKVPQITQAEIGFNPNKLALAGSKDIWLAVQRREALDEIGKIFGEKISAQAIQEGLIAPKDADEVIKGYKFVEDSDRRGQGQYSLLNTIKDDCLRSVVEDRFKTNRQPPYLISEWAEIGNRMLFQSYKIDIEKLPKLPAAEQAAGQVR